MIIWEVDGLDAFDSGEINFFSPDVFRDRGEPKKRELLKK